VAFIEELDQYGSRVAIQPQDEVGLLDLEALFADLDEEALIYCCGPQPLLEAVESLAAGRPAGTLHVERFEAKPRVAPAPTESIEVVLARSGSTVSVDPDQSILKAVQAAGVAVLCSCTEGVCGTGETEVLEGVPDHRDSILSEEERDAGDCMMICVSRALTPRLVLAL
jgi:ferredoxin